MSKSNSLKSKRRNFMKKGLLFTVLTCAFAMGVASCQPASTPTPEPQPESYEVSITNKAALQAEWRVGDAARAVTVKIPGVVTQEALAKGDLVISSDHTDILSIAGNQASPVATGSARITATYKANTQWSDYVDVTIGKAPIYKMAQSLNATTEYLLAHKNGDGSGRLVAASMAVSSGYYIGWENSLDDAAVSKVVIDEEATTEYKYAIEMSKTSAEGEVTKKTVGVAVTAKGKFAAGFADEEVEYNGKKHTPVKALFKLDDEHRLVCKVADTFDNDKEYDLYFGASGTYNTTGFGSDASKIVNPTRLYELSTVEIPATKLTVTPESIELHPNGVQALTVEIEPFDTTDELSFKSNDEGVAKVSISGKVSGVAVGTTKIVVSVGALTKEIPVTIAGDPIEFGTKENPLTVDQAVKSLTDIGKNNMSPAPLYVKGTVKEVQEWSTSYKNGTFWLANAAGEKKFELYRAVVVEGIDGSAIKAGDEVKAYGYGELFNTTYELTTNPDGNPASPTIYERVEGVPPVDPDPIEATVAEAKTEAAKLTDTTSSDKYAVTGYITKIKTAYSSQFHNITVFIGDNVGDSEADSLQAYRAKTDDDTAPKLVVGAQIKITGYLSNSTQYGMQIAEGGEITFLKEAEVQPQTINATVAEAMTVLAGMEAGAKTTDNYAVTGYVIKIDTAYNAQFGNMSITIADEADATTGLLAYRTKCSAEVSAKVLVGAQVKVTGVLDKNSHGDQIGEGSAVEVVKESPVTPPEPTVINATVAEAIAALNDMEVGTSESKYAVTGYIVSLAAAYDVGGFISLNLGDTADATSTCLAYHVTVTAAQAAQMLKGAKVTVTGNLEVLSYAKRIAAGSTVTVVTAAEAKRPVEVTAPYTLDCSIKGAGNAYADANVVKQGDVEWAAMANTTIDGCWKIGGKSLTNAERRVFSLDAMTVDFDKVSVEFGTKDSQATINSLTVEVYSTYEKVLAGGAGDVASISGTFAASSTISFAKADTASWANCYYSIVINMNVTGSSNKGVQLKSVVLSVTPAA